MDKATGRLRPYQKEGSFSSQNGGHRGDTFPRLFVICAAASHGSTNAVAFYCTPDINGHTTQMWTD